MKTKSLIFCLFCLFYQSKTVAQLAIPIDNFEAKWLMHPTIPPQYEAVIFFRKTVNFAQKPSKFIVHVSADNHYRLFVNGKYITRGPARCDLSHWFYETIDLADYLNAGKNVVAAEVVNWGAKRQFTQFSQMTSFWLQGHGDAKLINTDFDGWKCQHNKGHFIKPVDWIFDKSSVAFGLYVASPTDSIVAQDYPWGWQNADFDDATWQIAKWCDNAGGRETQSAGGILYGGGKMLIPRRSPLLSEKKERFAQLIFKQSLPEDVSEKSFLTDDFIQEKGLLRIPPNKKVTLWLDQKVMTVGYPELMVSGGKGAHIGVRYAETLFKTARLKGNRNEWEGKKFIGIKDVFMPDGGNQRVFVPTYMRNFRFIQLEISTQNDPLSIEHYFNIKSTADLTQKAQFECDDASLTQIMDMGWRTVHNCAQDILMSDGYYEQMQYVGDSRVHNLTLMTLSGDDKLTRNALIQFDESRIPEGLTYACYPNPFHLIIPSYSLIHIDQLHDYMMWQNDTAFLKKFDLGIYSILDWFEKRVQPDGILGKIDWWAALAWPKGYENGVPPDMEKGSNALYTLHYAYTLRHAADIFRFIGNDFMAKTCLERADRCCKAVKKLCFNQQKGLFQESPTLQKYAQITNILAILSETVTGDDAKKLMTKVLKDTSLTGKVDLFLHVYLFEAMNKTGMNAAFFDEISEWRTMLNQGLTTCVEVPIEWGEENQRSECHPWSTIPNTHFFKTVCGIRPITAGHRQVEIAPELGHLTRVNAVYPHPMGSISLNLKLEKNKLKATVAIPKGMTAVFKWQGKTINLKVGEQSFELSP